MFSMRFITINRAKPNASVEFYGCPMQCKYCSHTTAAFKDHDLDSVVNAMSDNGIRSVFIGGTEPALHGKDALDLMRILKKRGKEILLKTTALDPDFVTSTKGMVSRYVLEVKSPLDDPETFSMLTSFDLAKSKEHLEKTKRTLEIMKGQKVRATLRVIPGVYDVAKVERIAMDLKGYADELLLTQFLSNPSDLPYGDKTSPGPSQDMMMEMGQAARKHIPRVRVRGNGFDITL